MYYKIELNTKTSQWEIFLSKWSDLWYCKIKGQAFATYDSAYEWCENAGMNRAYVHKSFPSYEETKPSQPISQTGGILKPKRVRKTA